MAQSSRLHFMDSLRAILMMLGVVLHSAQIYNPKQSWIILSDSNHWFFQYLVTIITEFRMPAFFIVSGYFCLLTIQKYKVKKFLSLRIKRLVIPFIATALTLNSIQAYVLDYTGWQRFELASYLLNGDYVGHLWFLVNLVIYFLFAALVAMFMGPIFSRLSPFIKRALKHTPVLILILLLPITNIVILSLNKIGFPLYTTYFGVVDVASILMYSPFFILGTLLALDYKIIERVCKTSPLALFIFIIVVNTVSLNIPASESNLLKVAVNYFEYLSIWLSAIFCFSVFYKYLNKKTNLFLRLSDASYTVYLFHHVLVIIIGLLLMALNVNIFISFIILITSVTVITLIVHNKLVLKFKILSWLYNGK